MITTLVSFSALLNLLIIFIAWVLAVFLFWRAGKYEFWDSELLLDTVIISSIGGLIFGRVWDFLIRFNTYNFSFAKFIFFNVYGGLDFYGVLLGFAVFGLFYLRARKKKYLEFFDLAVAPIVLAQMIVSFGKFGMSFLTKKPNLPFLYFAIGYFLIFWILKRLAKRKRNSGFFVGIYLLSISVLEIFLFWSSKAEMIGLVPYRLTLGILLLFFSSVFLYKVSKRNIGKDIKSIFAGVLLLFFKLKRILVSVEESGGLAKSILFSPYYLAKGVLALLKFLGQEILSGFWDLAIVLGIKKYK